MLDVDNLEDLRDVTIVAFTIAGTVLFLLAIVFTAIVGTMSFIVLRNVRSTLRKDLGPTLESVRETVDNLRGTATFVSETAVSPLIRAYSLYSGTRRFLGVFMRVFRRRQRS